MLAMRFGNAHSRSGQVILIVASDVHSRTRLRQVLEFSGFRVLEAAHQKDSEFICERYVGTIDLLLVEIDLQKVEGHKVAQHLAVPQSIVSSSGICWCTSRFSTRFDRKIFRTVGTNGQRFRYYKGWGDHSFFPEDFFHLLPQLGQRERLLQEWSASLTGLHSERLGNLRPHVEDLHLRPNRVMKDLLHTVMPGVNKAIELGIADPDLLAVMGQSYGSYCVLALITQTNRFKAAVATAVVDANLTSSYLFVNRDGTAGSLGYFEEGQGGMGGTLWQYRDRFIENSPLFYFDRVQTPLLMGHGTKDSTPLSYPDHIFVALRRLGKEVEYRQYEGEDHVISRKANVIDFWQRRLDFLAEHLDLVLNEKGAIVFEGNHAGSRKGPAARVPSDDQKPN